jgi:hypothetical protein
MWQVIYCLIEMHPKGEVGEGMWQVINVYAIKTPKVRCVRVWIKNQLVVESYQKLGG